MFPFPICCLFPVSDHLHWYSHGYIRTCHHERAYVAIILNTQGIPVLNGPGNVYIPVWVDMLQAGSEFWHHRSIVTVLGLTSSNVHCASRCLSYLWNEQGEYCCCSNFIVGTAISGVSSRLDVLEKVSWYFDDPAQMLSSDTEGIQIVRRGCRSRDWSPAIASLILHTKRRVRPMRV